MSKALCFILILFTTWQAQAAQYLFVVVDQKQELLCQQEAKSAFWSCSGDRLLFIGEPIVGQVPTLHSLQAQEVKVPARIFDPKVSKELYSNSQNFQYQQGGMSAAESYYRKHNLMMSFEPRLRSCSLTDCQKLKAILNPVLYRPGVKITAALNANLTTDLQQQAKLLPSMAINQSKSIAQMASAFANVKVNSSLRYDYLRDGCFARSQVVAAQLAEQDFEVYKIWLHGFSLWGERFEKPSDFFGWRYHVAPIVRVDGQFWVFDPGLFSEPVAAYQWINAVLGPNEKVIVANKFAEDDLAAKATVAVSLSQWQIYPNYVNTTNSQSIDKVEISKDIEDAQMVLEDLEN